MVKGGLSDDSIANLQTIIKPGSTVMLLGTPDANLLSKPAEKHRFVEDLSPDQQVQQFNSTPLGLQNMGNTCYLNATLQALFRADELKDLILQYDPSKVTNSDPNDEIHYKIVLELKRTFETLKREVLNQCCQLCY